MSNPDGRSVLVRVYGLDPAQLEWLDGSLKDAAARGLKAVICSHSPPAGWVNAADFEKLIASSGCVKAIFCGHCTATRSAFSAESPSWSGRPMSLPPSGTRSLHLYPDGRILAIQKSQHFPFDDFISAGFRTGGLGPKADRYLTIGGKFTAPTGSVEGSEAAMPGPRSRTDICALLGEANGRWSWWTVRNSGTRA